MVSQLTVSLTQDTAKCEIRILGNRHVGIDVQALCDRLDLVLGSRVAGVIMNQHEFRLGKEDAAKIRLEKPQATLREIVDIMVEAERASGVGVINVAAPDKLLGPIELEISNPCVKRAAGASEAFIFSYWCGVFSHLLGKEFKVNYATYDGDRDLLKAEIVQRLVNQE